MINKTIERLKDIRQIADFQIKRLENKKAVNKEVTLRTALNILEEYINEIRGENL